jgi:uncharacterized membrane protein YagU involved in acid resistance
MDFMRAEWFSSYSALSSRKRLQGALAGFIGTAPMSISMVIGWRLLPRREKYHLPPRLIMNEITERAGIEDRMNEHELIGLTVFSHFSYGAFFGWLYTLFEHRLPFHSSLKGALAGLALWAGSYLGWLPVLGILPSALRHSWRRNLLMIVAHVIWGVTMSESLRKLTEKN